MIFVTPKVKMNTPRTQNLDISQKKYNWIHSVLLTFWMKTQIKIFRDIKNCFRDDSLVLLVQNSDLLLELRFLRGNEAKLRKIVVLVFLRVVVSQLGCKTSGTLTQRNGARVPGSGWWWWGGGGRVPHNNYNDDDDM